ncbi:unnamed protein product [Sympodiomycopsis kandeliae]
MCDDAVGGISDEGGDDAMEWKESTTRCSEQQPTPEQRQTGRMRVGGARSANSETTDQHVAAAPHQT